MSDIIKKYDLVIPIGRFCHCSSLLNNYDLKRFSGPWDWSGTGADEGIYKRLEALINGFDGWFERKDFIPLEGEYAHYLIDYTDPLALRPTVELHQSSSLPPPCVWYYNKRTMTYYGHDFHLKKKFDDQFETIKSQYIRRFKRINKFIEKSHSILLVYMNHIADQKRDLPLDEDIVLKYIEDLRKKYPHKIIDFYMFDHANNVKGDSYTRYVYDIGIIRYVSNHENIWDVDDDNYRHQANGFMMPKSICNILEKISLTDRFKMI